MEKGERKWSLRNENAEDEPVLLFIVNYLTRVSMFLLGKRIGPKTNPCKATSLQGTVVQRLGTRLNSRGINPQHMVGMRIRTLDNALEFGVVLH